MCSGRASGIDVPWSGLDVLRKNHGGKALLQGTVELNDKVVQAEERPTEAEQQTDATQQDLDRLQQTKSRGKWKAPAPTHLEQGTVAFEKKYQPQPFDGEDDRWRARARVGHSWSGRFLGGALADIYEHWSLTETAQPSVTWNL